MDQGSIEFSTEQFNILFPFFLFFYQGMNITGSGRSIGKVCPVKEKIPFNQLFIVKRPETPNPEFSDLISISGKMTILESQYKEGIVLRGQFLLIRDNNTILFLGSPWFGSMDQVRAKKLTLDDFAVHDSMIDLLHVLKTQEIVTEDIKELLKTVNFQKEKLKKDQEELRRLSLVASANEDGVLFTNPEGRITWINEGYCRITGFNNDELTDKAFTGLLKLESNEKKRLEELQEALSSGRNLDLEMPHYRKDKSIFWAKIKSQSTLDKTGALLHSFVNIEDITSQKQQEEQLRVLSLIAEDNINAVIIADANGRIEWINKSFTRMTGYGLEEVKNKKPGEVLQGPETDPKRLLI
jgi:PAS domain S-box-containing protein